MDVEIIKTDVLPVSLFVEDQNNQIPSDDGTLLFENRTHAPILDRNESQLTWGDFRSVGGTIIVQGLDEGTTISLSMNGLIPNGLYTVWNVTFKSPGFSLEEDNLIGVGVMGSKDGSESFFRADENGNGTFTGSVESGALSMMGQIEKYPFKDEVEWHVVGSYHMDDQTHGPDLGPDGTVVEQFAFIFSK